MPDLSLFISKTGFCFFIIPILCSRARQFVRSKLHIFDKIRHRIRNHKKPAEFAVENRRKIFIYSLRCMSHLRLRARAFQPYTLSARRMTESARRCAVPSVGSRGYVLASSTMRVRDRSLGDSFRRFLVGEKTTSLFSFVKEECVLFLSTQEKNEKKPQAYRLTVRASQEHVSSAPGTCLRTAGVRNPRRNTPNGRQVRYGGLAPAGADFPVVHTVKENPMKHVSSGFRLNRL